jgi:hypothetical protein
MKFVQPRPYADPEAAACKLLEIANATEAVQDGRIHTERINGPFLYAHKRNTRPASIWRLPRAGSGCTRAAPT